MAEEAAAQARADSKKPSGGSRALKTLPMLVVLVLLAVLVPSFVARVYAIPSGSMETTLHGCTGCDNDKVLVDKLTYRFSTPQVGDVLVFARPATWTNSELGDPPQPTGALGRMFGEIGSTLGIQAAGETDLIKRVVAVGGQTVSCCDSRNRVEVNGQPVDEPFVYYSAEFGPAEQRPFGPVRVPEGSLWMMGDSRNNSVDSRAQGDGPVPLADVIGKARLIVMPFSRFGPLAH
ncbi:signal peptidase I [Pseudonocardia spinosispora]|uniref:signal peptidase I n=1 Tax=Pseudonocardia spinosispora TaxID=103441 RepID=UPI0006842D57|nr:signal peptidase I [Pseudonocardia spinosispora]